MRAISAGIVADDRRRPTADTEHDGNKRRLYETEQLVSSHIIDKLAMFVASHRLARSRLLIQQLRHENSLLSDMRGLQTSFTIRDLKTHLTVHALWSA